MFFHQDEPEPHCAAAVQVRNFSQELRREIEKKTLTKETVRATLSKAIFDHRTQENKKTKTKMKTKTNKKEKTEPTVKCNYNDQKEEET